MLRRRFAVALVLALPVVAACGTDASGVDACRQIEEARCHQAPNCGVDMSIPPHRGSTPEADVGACIRWYHDACLHGLAVADPGGPQTQACVAAINTGDCETVAHPETNKACSWLYPEPPVDAGPDAADAGAQGDAQAPFSITR